MTDAESIQSVLEQLDEVIVQLKRDKYELQRKIDQSGRYKTTLAEIRGVAHGYQQALVDITWAEDLESAQEIAQQSLRAPRERLEGLPGIFLPLDPENA